MNLDSYFFATKADIDRDFLNDFALDGDSWEQADEKGDILSIDPVLKNHYILNRYIFDGYSEHIKPYDFQNHYYVISNTLVEHILALAKNRDYDAFEIKDDELIGADQQLSEIEQVFIKCQEYANQGYKIVYYPYQ